MPKRDRTHQLFKAYEPGFVHVDNFYLPALGAVKRYCFIAIDRATRMAFLRVYDDKTGTSARDFLERALAFFPFRLVKLLTDNGPEFTNRRYGRSPRGARRTHPLDVLCNQYHIQRRFTAPYTPRTNGMAERFVGLAKAATVSKYRYPSHQLIEDDLFAWCRFYNLHRPHSGIARRTPLQECQRWQNLRPNLFIRDPALNLESVLNLARPDT